MDYEDELGKKIISNIDRHFRVDPKMYACWSLSLHICAFSFFAKTLNSVRSVSNMTG